MQSRAKAPAPEPRVPTPLAAKPLHAAVTATRTAMEQEQSPKDGYRPLDSAFAELLVIGHQDLKIPEAELNNMTYAKL